MSMAPSSTPSMAPSSMPSTSPTTSPTFGVFENLEKLKAAVDEWIIGGESRISIENKYRSITEWDVSNVVTFENLFSASRNPEMSEFSADISNWIVSGGSSFESMFEGAAKFNINLEQWDMVSATTLKNMFNGATEFNQDLRTWYDQLQATISAGGSVDVTDMFEGTKCAVSDDPLQEVLEGDENYFCHRSATPLLTRSSFLYQARLSATLSATTYYQDGIDVSRIDYFDEDKVEFKDYGGYTFDTVVVARDKNQIYLAFRGTDIPEDEWEQAIWKTSTEADDIEDETPETLYNFKCQAHENLYYVASWLQSDGWYTDKVDTFIGECEAEYGSGNCELIITGHSAGGALATGAALIYGLSSWHVRVYTFGGVPIIIDDGGCDEWFDTANFYNFYSRINFALGTDVYDPVFFMPFNNDYWHVGKIIEIEFDDVDFWQMPTGRDNNQVKVYAEGSLKGDKRDSNKGDTLYCEGADEAQECSNGNNKVDIENFMNMIPALLETRQAYLHMAGSYKDWFDGGLSNTSIKYQ